MYLTSEVKMVYSLFLILSFYCAQGLFFHKCSFAENRNLTDNDVEVYPMDVLDLDSHEKAFEHVINKFGKVDLVILAYYIFYVNKNHQSFN